MREVDDLTRQNLVRIEGEKGMTVQFAKCCNPMPGHALIGYITKSAGLTVHRADCKSFAKSNRDAARVIEASWEGEGLYETRFRVSIGQRPNVLSDLTNALRPINIDILRAEYRLTAPGVGCFDFIVETSGKSAINRIVRTMNTVSGVTEVHAEPVDKEQSPPLSLAVAG